MSFKFQIGQLVRVTGNRRYRGLISVICQREYGKKFQSFTGKPLTHNFYRLPEFPDKSWIPEWQLDPYEPPSDEVEEKNHEKWITNRRGVES